MNHLRALGYTTSALLFGILAIGACGDSDETTSNSGGSDATSSSSANGGTGAGTTSIGGGAPCQAGTTCDGGNGICADDGTCCAAESICEGVCCSSGDICSFAQCATPGGPCIDSDDCETDEYCDRTEQTGSGGAGGGGGGGVGGGGGDNLCPEGFTPPSGRCLPRPPVCPDGMDPGDPPTCLRECRHVPTPGQFNPAMTYAWGDPLDTTNNVMMSPIIIQLDDDNCDNAVNERDIPEIVFFTFNGNDYNNGGGTSATLRAISMVNGQVVEKFNVVTAGDAPGRSIAAGDFHSGGSNEIAVCTTDGRVRAYDATGQVLWTSDPVACLMPSIVDIDQDGQAEIVVRRAILNGETGAIEVPYVTNSNYVAIADIDADGLPDIVTATSAFNAAGTQIADATGSIVGNHVAVGDLDLDGKPEIIAVNSTNHTVSVWQYDVNEPNGFRVVRSALDINEGIAVNHCCTANPNSAGCTRGGGPPTIAKFNNDASPDVGLAAGIGYVVFDGAKLMDATVLDADTRAWLTTTQDCSSAQTGSSVFDFDGDGQAEVVYGDERTLHIYSGQDGTELFQTCNTNGTLVEYPLIADVDNDGHADIVAVSNSYSGFNCGGTKTTGVRVFSAGGDWVRTRRIWNQHPYYVSNVNEDGSIPTLELPNYLQPKLNNFRQNIQPSGEFLAPDLVVEVFPACDGNGSIVVRVQNVGEASVPPGVVVGLYEGDPANGGTLLGQMTTVTSLYPLGTEDVLFPLANAPVPPLFGVADDGMPVHTWRECRDDNNVNSTSNLACGPL